jgi:hypothetical protein
MVPSNPLQHCDSQACRGLCCRQGKYLHSRWNVKAAAAATAAADSWQRPQQVAVKGLTADELLRLVLGITQPAQQDSTAAACASLALYGIQVSHARLAGERSHVLTQELQRQQDKLLLNQLLCSSIRCAQRGVLCRHPRKAVHPPARQRAVLDLSMPPGHRAATASASRSASAPACMASHCLLSGGCTCCCCFSSSRQICFAAASAAAASAGHSPAVVSCCARLSASDVAIELLLFAAS